MAPAPAWASPQPQSGPSRLRSAADVEAAARVDGYANRWFLDPVLRASTPRTWPAFSARSWARTTYVLTTWQLSRPRSTSWASTTTSAKPWPPPKVLRSRETSPSPTSCGRGASEPCCPRNRERMAHRARGIDTAPDPDRHRVRASALYVTENGAAFPDYVGPTGLSMTPRGPNISIAPQSGSRRHRRRCRPARVLLLEPPRQFPSGPTGILTFRARLGRLQDPGADPQVQRPVVRGGRVPQRALTRRMTVDQPRPAAEGAPGALPLRRLGRTSLMVTAIAWARRPRQRAPGVSARRRVRAGRPDRPTCFR